MDLRKALEMLQEFEELEGRRVDLEPEDVAWWNENVPGFPKELLTYMKEPVGGGAAVEQKAKKIPPDSEGHCGTLVFRGQPDSLEEDLAVGVCLAFSWTHSLLSL